jgi:serine/threonine protein kinase
VGFPGAYASPFLHDVDLDPISGCKFINHYEIVDELGRGTHGKVKLGRDLKTADSYVAIKIVERYSKRRRLGKLGNAEDKVKKEVAILKKARHPNIVALLEVIDDPSRKKVYIVLEWVERGDITWRVKAPKEIAIVEARRYEREKRAKSDSAWDAEDDAVLAEAQRRLRRQKRLLIRATRTLKRDTLDNTHTWSHEMDDEFSDDSDDDRLSRASATTAGSLPSEVDIAKLMVGVNRRISRKTSPVPKIPQKQETNAFLTPAEERPYEELDMTLSSSPVQMSDSISHKSLDGAMYGAYDSSSGENSRVHSGASGMQPSAGPSRHSTGDLSQIAPEVFESDLNTELEYVPCMPIQSVRVAFRDTLLGLQYLHYRGIVHRDIKPPNLLQTIDHRVKISDFSVSYLGRPLHDKEALEELSESEAHDLDEEAKELAKTVGTPAFFAPELCITDPMDYPFPVTKAIDVWALGITLFCMLYARTPYVDNEVVVMRQIADEEIYIPRKRLLPINTKSQSRPSSHERIFPPVGSGKRHELDLCYEKIDDDLFDLLKRLLTKDPGKRITLEEVRHHPWVLADLPNPKAWLEETDSNRQSQGKNIEVSNEDVNTAVVPLQWVERVRSGIKRVGERLGSGSALQRRSRSGS